MAEEVWQTPHRLRAAPVGLCAGRGQVGRGRSPKQVPAPLQERAQSAEMAPGARPASGNGSGAPAPRPGRRHKEISPEPGPRCCHSPSCPPPGQAGAPAAVTYPEWGRWFECGPPVDPTGGRLEKGVPYPQQMQSQAQVCCVDVGLGLQFTSPLHPTPTGCWCLSPFSLHKGGLTWHVFRRPRTLLPSRGLCGLAPHLTCRQHLTMGKGHPALSLPCQRGR